MRIQKTKEYAYRNGDLKEASAAAAASRWFHLALALILLLPALSAYGQFESATVLGYARDTSGAAIPNSTVTLTNTATGIVQKATTDTDGRYEFASIPIGKYTIVTEAAGFEKAQTQPFTLTTDSRQRVDVSMKPGARQRDCNGVRRADCA